MFRNRNQVVLPLESEKILQKTIRCSNQRRYVTNWITAGLKKNMYEHGESSILQRCLSYADKFKSSNNLDEILLASTNYINEDLNHTRKDNIKEFARGEVLIRVGANDYSAKVIVGFTAGKQMLLYDIVDFAPTNIATKKRTHQDFGESRTPRKDVFSNITVTQKSPSVNSILSENPKKITTETKNTAENSGVKRQNSIENKAAYGTAQTKLTKEYRAAVDRVLNMQDTTADNLVIGYTPELMKDMGMPALPFVIGTGHVYSAAKTEAEARKDGNYRKGVHYHGLGDTVVKNIYEQLQDPVMIIAAKDVNGNASPLRSTHSVVAIVDIGTANNSLLLPVEITAERTVDGQQMDANVLSSVYDRNVKNLIKEAIALENSGDVGIYYAKKEADALIPAGVQFPVRIQKAIASNPIVRSFDEKVNRKISDVTQSLQFMLDNLREYMRDRDTAQSEYLKIKNRSPGELYKATAGEIEARDTAKRANLTAGERKNTRPDIDRTDVVFANNSSESMEIVTLDNGKQYVHASEQQVIEGNNSQLWKQQIARYINKELRNWNDFDILTVEGDVLTLTKNTAYKAGSVNQVRNQDGTYRAMTQAEYLTKLNAEVHINELAQISKKIKKPNVPDSKNHSFAKNGFSYRTAYFQDYDGEYYKITLSVGENGNISTVYNVGKLKKDTLPNGTIKSVFSGSKADSVSNALR